MREPSLPDNGYDYRRLARFRYFGKNVAGESLQLALNGGKFRVLCPESLDSAKARQKALATASESKRLKISRGYLAASRGDRKTPRAARKVGCHRRDSQHAVRGELESRCSWQPSWKLSNQSGRLVPFNRERYPRQMRSHRSANQDSCELAGSGAKLPSARSVFVRRPQFCRR